MIVVLDEDVKLDEGFANVVDKYDDLRYCINDISEISFDRVDGCINLLSEDGWIGVKIEDVDKIKEG